MGVRDWLILFVVVALVSLGLWQSQSRGTASEPDIFGPHCAVSGIADTCLPRRQ
jgi:hypothetical protein